MVSLLNKLHLERYVRSPRWAEAFLLACAIFGGMFALNTLLAEIQPGNWWGLTYGWVAAVLMYGAGFYGVRRRMLNRNLGQAKAWVDFHVYGGTLAALLFVFHTGFRLPDGLFNWLLWLLAVWVTLSGFLGVGLQKWIPGILASGLSVEAVYERIPELVMQLRERAEKLVASCSAPIRDFYEAHVATELSHPMPKFSYYLDVTGGIQARLRSFDFLRRVLPQEERNSLDQLQLIYKTKLELDAHASLQKALRWWLYTHVPLSMVLMLMILLHIWAVWYY